MVSDIKAIVWKEWREFFFQQSIKSKIQTIVLIAVIGVALPVNKGAHWFDLPFFYGVAVMGPVLMMVTVVCDLFVGERERHTLETLLASRLSDKSIVLGKILFAVSYATSITALLIALNIIALNLAYYKSSILIFSPRSALILTFINFFTAFLAALIGIAVSIGAKTVKQGQLTLTVSFLILVLLPPLLIKNLPNNFTHVFSRFYNSISSVTAFTLTALILIVVNLAILKFILYRFKTMAYNF